jgi:hypothetical protein
MYVIGQQICSPFFSCSPKMVVLLKVQATMYVIGQGVLTPEEAQPYFAFLQAKSRPFPRCSAALSHFLIEALYIIAEGQGPESNEAADLAFELMARDGLCLVLG